MQNVKKCCIYSVIHPIPIGGVMVRVTDWGSKGPWIESRYRHYVLSLRKTLITFFSIGPVELGTLQWVWYEEMYLPHSAVCQHVKLSKGPREKYKKYGDMDLDV